MGSHVFLACHLRWWNLRWWKGWFTFKYGWTCHAASGVYQRFHASLSTKQLQFYEHTKIGLVLAGGKNWPGRRHQSWWPAEWLARRPLDHSIDFLAAVRWVFTSTSFDSAQYFRKIYSFNFFMKALPALHPYKTTTRRTVLGSCICWYKRTVKCGQSWTKAIKTRDPAFVSSKSKYYKSQSAGCKAVHVIKIPGDREKENGAGACFTARRITGKETSSSHAANMGEEMTTAY
jgi:hypothetical protein